MIQVQRRYTVDKQPSQEKKPTPKNHYTGSLITIYSTKTQKLKLQVPAIVGDSSVNYQTAFEIGTRNLKSIIGSDFGDITFKRGKWLE